MMRRISCSELRSFFESKGKLPVISSYSVTPREYTSVRVSMSRPESSACSGLMYSGVPMTWPTEV